MMGSGIYRIHKYWARRPTDAVEYIIRNSFGDIKGKTLLDPFGGGGIIPFVAAKLGAKAIYNDNNPVAVTVSKAIFGNKGVKLSNAVRRLKSFMREFAEKYYGENPPDAYLHVVNYKCDCGRWTPVIDYEYPIPVIGRKNLGSKKFTCVHCGMEIPRKEMRTGLRNGRTQYSIGAISKNGVYYKPRSEDYIVFDEVPDMRKKEIELNTKYATIKEMGIRYISQLFNKRQYLLLETYAKWVRDNYANNQDIAVLLTVMLGYIIRYNSKMCTPRPRSGSIDDVYEMFSRKKISMKRIYVEYSPLYIIDRAYENLKFSLADIGNGMDVDVLYGDARRIPIKEGSVDFVLTDPPYYELVDYGGLSDIFYRFYRIALGNTLPEMYGERRIVKLPEDVDEFTEMLAEAFAEVRRVLADNGKFAVMYMHPREEGWRPLINAMRIAGFDVEDAYTVDGEMKGRNSTNSGTKNVVVVMRKGKRRQKLPFLSLKGNGSDGLCDEIVDYLLNKY